MFLVRSGAMCNVPCLLALSTRILALFACGSCRGDQMLEEENERYRRDVNGLGVQVDGITDESMTTDQNVRENACVAYVDNRMARRWPFALTDVAEVFLANTLAKRRHWCCTRVRFRQRRVGGGIG